MLARDDDGVVVRANCSVEHDRNCIAVCSCNITKNCCTRRNFINLDNEVCGIEIVRNSSSGDPTNACGTSLFCNSGKCWCACRTTSRLGRSGGKVGACARLGCRPSATLVDSNCGGAPGTCGNSTECCDGVLTNICRSDVNSITSNCCSISNNIYIENVSSLGKSITSENCSSNREERPVECCASDCDASVSCKYPTAIGIDSTFFNEVNAPGVTSALVSKSVARTAAPDA